MPVPSDEARVPPKVAFSSEKVAAVALAVLSVALAGVSFYALFGSRKVIMAKLGLKVSAALVGVGGIVAAALLAYTSSKLAKPAVSEESEGSEGLNWAYKPDLQAGFSLRLESHICTLTHNNQTFEIPMITQEGRGGMWLKNDQELRYIFRDPDQLRSILVGHVANGVSTPHIYSKSYVPSVIEDFMMPSRE